MLRQENEPCFPMKSNTLSFSVHGFLVEKLCVGIEFEMDLLRGRHHVFS